VDNGLPEIISFDHDLTDVVELKEDLPIEEWFDLENSREYTGMDCARWLMNYCLETNKPLPKYVIHSSNPDGSKNMEELLSKSK
jgi:hypothetical protein